MLAIKRARETCSRIDLKRTLLAGRFRHMAGTSFGWG